MTPFKIPVSAVVKNSARAALRGRWPEAIAVSCTGLFSLLIMFFLCSVVPVYTDKNLAYATAGFTFVFSVLVISPLFLGIVRYFWRLTDGAGDDISAAFYYFGAKKRYFRALKLTFVVGWRVVAACAVCMLPYLVANTLSGTWFYQLLDQEIPLWAANLVLIESFLYIVGVICAILYISRYYLVAVIAAMDEELLLLEAVHISCMVSRRSGSAFISLLVSLLGWMLLTVFMLPALYTLPLMLACYVIHCRYAMANYNLILEYYENNMSGSY